MYGPGSGPPERPTFPKTPPPSPGGIGVLVGSEPQIHDMIAWDIFKSERDEYLQELYDAANLSIHLDEAFERARQEDNRLMGRLAL